jgi:regulatory protein
MDNPKNISDMSQDMTQAENIKPASRRKEKKPPKKITEKYLYNSGLAYLQKFTSSVPNFRRVMTRKIDKSCTYHKEQSRDASLQMLETTIATFERQGLLNDEAYLAGMVNSLRRRGLSAQAIQYKLQQKGLKSEAIKEVLAAHSGDLSTAEADLLAAAQFIRRKKLGCYGKPLGREEEKARNRQIGALARAGFGFDITQKILAMDEDGTQELLDQQSH